MEEQVGGMELGEAQRLRSLGGGEAAVEAPGGDLGLDKEALKAIVRKNGWNLPA